MRCLLSGLLLNFLIFSNAWANSPWEGKWEYGRYAPSISGFLTISDCANNKCEFEIMTEHGAHFCEVKGTLKTKGNKARFYKYETFFGNQEILFELNSKKKSINVTRKDGRFCGMRGYLDGIYEHESSPYRFKTSFDCWAENLTPTEKTICSSFLLAKADLEFDANFYDIKTTEWFKNRNECNDDQDCIQNFYKNSILNAFSDVKRKKFNLYNYVQNQKQKWYYPTDLLLFNDFFLNSMPKKYYEAWIVSLDDDSYTHECKDCIAHSYGVAGLYKSYESAVYLDKDQVWLAFISANLPEPENKNIIVFAQRGKSFDDMPQYIKDFTDNLIKSEYYKPDSVKLLHFKEPSLKEKFMKFINSINF